MRTDISKNSGLWQGIEIEHTQFKGLPTLFVSRASALVRALHYQAQHIYIDLDDIQFWQGTEIGLLAVLAHVKNFLKLGRRVTLGVCAKDLGGIEFTTAELRRDFPSTFCLLVSIYLRYPDLGGYAVKIVPPTPFSTAPETLGKETGVMVRTADEFEKGRTIWSEYIGDKDLP